MALSVGGRTGGGFGATAFVLWIVLDVFGWKGLLGFFGIAFVFRHDNPPLLLIALCDVVGIVVEIVFRFDAFPALQNHFLHILRQRVEVLLCRRACAKQAAKPLAGIVGVLSHILKIPPFRGWIAFGDIIGKIRLIIHL